VTKAAFARFGKQAPAMPAALVDFLWPDKDDREGCHRMRGLGWALAPAGSDPQMLHADIWGDEYHPRRGRVRFPHILWKRGGSGRKPVNCTTEIVPYGFTHGVPNKEHYIAIQRASAPAIIMDSEILHRGAATPPATETSSAWVSSCSVEICSPTGWIAWEGGTGGTQKPIDDEDDDWKMLPCKPQPCSKDMLKKIDPVLIAEQKRWEGIGCSEN